MATDETIRIVGMNMAELRKRCNRKNMKNYARRSTEITNP